MIKIKRETFLAWALVIWSVVVFVAYFKTMICPELGFVCL